MKYTDIPLDNISLNLSKNQLQPSYWKDMNAYAFDNMVQPISKTDIGYKNNFVMGDDLYSIDGKKLYKNNKLLHDYTNEYLTKTIEYTGYKKGNYKLGTDDNFYYKDTALLSVDYDSSSLWVHSSKDYAILLCSEGLYYFTGITFTRYNIPSFEFDDAVQVDYDSGIFLFESDSKGTDDILTVSSYVNKLSSGSVVQFALPSTWPLVYAEGVGTSTGSGTAVNLSGDLVTGTEIKYHITKSDDPTKFRVTPYSWSSAAINSSLSIADSATLPSSSMAYLYLQNYAEYSNNSTTPVYSKAKLDSLLISQADSSGIVSVVKPITVNAVEYKDYGNEVSGFKITFNVYSVSAYTTARAYLLRDTNTYSTTSTYIPDTAAVSLKNTSIRFTNNDFDFIYQSDVLKYISYKNKLIALPFIIDDYYINSDNSLTVYSSTIKKSYDISFSTDNDIVFTQIGNEIVSNSLTNTFVTINGVKSYSFDVITAEVKYPGVVVTTFHDLYSSLGSAYIGYANNDAWEGATEVYTSDTLDKQLLSDLVDFKGFGDVYTGTTGTVSYTLSVNNDFIYKKNIDKEYGVSEEATYNIPVTDNIKVLLDYDIYSTFVKIQGYTIQLSVVDNEIQSTVTLASIEGDTQAIFTIQGQNYQIIKNSIYSFTSSGESGLENQQFITPCKFDYIGYDDTAAYFWDPLTKNIICFTGNNQMSTLQSMSLLDDIVFSDYDVEHQMLVLSTTDKTYVKLYNNWMSFDFPTTTSALIYNDKLLLDNHQLILGEGDLDIQTGWIYNNNANQPLINLENIFVTLLEKGDITVTVEFMSPDKNISTMTKTYNNTEYVKITPTVLLCKAVRLHITSDVAVTGITIAVDDKTKESPISNKQHIEI